MKKKILFLGLMLFLAFTVVLIGCSADTDGDTDQETPPVTDGNGEGEEENGEESPIINKDITGTINVWGANDFLQGIEEFNEIYPNITVNGTVIGWEDYNSNLKTVLATGNGVPDAFEVHHGNWGEYNVMPGLANLLEPPYNMGDFSNDIPEGNFNKMLSPDGTRMFAFAADFPAAVNFYRADLYEEVGLPSDPNELVAYMSDWDNVFDMADRLKARDRYMFSESTTIFNQYLNSVYPFDAEMNYQWNDDAMAEQVDIAKRIHDGGYAHQEDLWSDAGKQAVASGQVTNVYIGAWFDGMLKGEWGGPDVEGNWRITALPGGIYSGDGGTLWAAYENTEYPEAVAAWIQYRLPNLERYENEMADGSTWVPSYAPAWEVEGFDVAYDPFYGDQPVKMAIREIIQRVPAYVPTPLDGEARAILQEHVIGAIEEGTNSRAALQNAQEDIERRLATQIQERKELLGIE